MSTFSAYESTCSVGQTARSIGPKRALCIGIDNYPNPGDRLRGCVNDARNWSNWFQGQGFSVDTLTDGQATRSGIVNAIRQVITTSQSGQVIAIQYSGHGTRLQDVNGDEVDGKDEALVPFDHRQNGYVVDDDLASICNQIPAGVNATFFMDCCHSGTITRLFVGAGDATDTDVKIRFLSPDAEMIEAHRRSRQGFLSNRTVRSPYAGRAEILLSACRSDQTAKERGAQGDFTRYALAVLRQGIGGMSNGNFIDRVRATGTWQDQHPQLWSDSSLYDQPLLGLRAGGGDNTPAIPAIPAGQVVGGSLSQTLADIDALLSKLRGQVREFTG
ncbi:MAG TPA: caspase family protein [Pirellulaceae bacterium]|nr:caspase family protein [Pirellulaceae bacterium]